MGCVWKWEQLENNGIEKSIFPPWSDKLSTVCARSAFYTITITRKSGGSQVACSANR